MEKLLAGIIILGIFIIILALIFGVSFLAYWLVLWAGAPKYVAVIVAIAVFVIGGLGSNSRSN